MSPIDRHALPTSYQPRDTRSRSTSRSGLDRSRSRSHTLDASTPLLLLPASVPARGRSPSARREKKKRTRSKLSQVSPISTSAGRSSMSFCIISSTHYSFPLSVPISTLPNPTYMTLACSIFARMYGGLWLNQHLLRLSSLCSKKSNLSELRSC
jgi:hypothetical protein